jgi:hypothetical protein
VLRVPKESRVLLEHKVPKVFKVHKESKVL